MNILYLFVSGAKTYKIGEEEKKEVNIKREESLFPL